MQRRRRGRTGKARPPRWRAIVAALGGFEVVGAVGFAFAVVLALVLLNRPHTDSDAPYQPVAHQRTDGRIEGDAAAPVRIVAFADFQCPFCGSFTRDTEPLLRAEFVDADVASFEYHHLAFLGTESLRAAEAAECALQQGFFWEYHDILFQKQPPDGRENVGVYSPENLKRYAAELADVWRDLDPARPLDLAAFGACVDTRETRDEVERQNAVAGELGLRSTPTFMISGEVVAGAQPIEVFREVIARALADR
jgi:protein-disulfide isomerase